jgi:hypothetical protein
MTMDMSRHALLLILLIFMAACGQQEAPELADQSVADPSGAQAMVDLRSPSAEGSEIFFVNVSDGDTVSSPFQIEFGLEGMDVVPAGTEQEFSGHHHLLINQEELPSLNMPIPADSVHVHYGKGQTSAELSLPTGKHTLQVILGNHLHIPHDPPVVSEKITITVL